MNSVKSLVVLLSVLLISCPAIFLPSVAAQSDNQIKPSGAMPDPCLFPNPPSYCAPPPVPVPKDERKGIVLGIASVIRQDAIMGDQDLRGPANPKSNLEILNETGSGYVRLWVDMGVLQPTASSTSTIRTNPRSKLLIESLDGQIIEAKRNGLKVILTVHHSYPTWVVWYRGSNRPSGTCGDRKNIDREICQRVPEELDERSPWGRFIAFLVREYGFNQNKTDAARPDYNRYVDFLEVVNEPNLTHRTPEKRTKGGRLVIALDVADMFVTAQKIVRDRNRALRDAGLLDPRATTLKLAGPATADTLMDGRITNYQEFTEELLLALKRRDFTAGSGFVWSHHAYIDFEEQRNCAPGDAGCSRTPHCPDYDDNRRRQKALSKINSVAWVEKTLRDGVGGYRWSGMRDGNNNPAIFITEAGVRLDQVVNIYWCHINGLRQPVDPGHDDYPDFAQAVKDNMGVIKEWQAELVGSSFNRLTTGPLSRGVMLIQNYLGYTDPIYDTGMRNYSGTCADWEADPRNAGSICTGENGGERPLFKKWRELPTP